QVGSKVTAQFFYRHAKFCASHHIFMIVLEIFIILLLCYPAFDVYYLNPVKNDNQAFFCEVSPSEPQVLKKTFADNCGTRPLFYVEQVIIKIANLGENNKGENASVLEKNLLLWILGLQERIENTIIRNPSLSSSVAPSTSIKYTLSDICFKPFNSNTCLIHSPLDYWSNNANHLSSDPSIQKTLSLTNTIYLGKFIPLNSVFGNVVYEGRKIISADSIILTYFLKEIEDYNKDLTISIWEEIWKQIINDVNTSFFFGDDPIKKNMFILMDAVAMIPTHLGVKERIAQGLEKIGYIITKTLVIWLIMLLICSATNIDSIKEFCIFTSIAMIITYILHMSFFVTALSIDLKRSELE
ncbi:20577_t:CDS:2, partial [Racocetra persica]